MSLHRPRGRGLWAPDEVLGERGLVGQGRVAQAGRVILLNGASSSGKSSLARTLQASIIRAAKTPPQSEPRCSPVPSTFRSCT